MSAPVKREKAYQDTDCTAFYLWAGAEGGPWGSPGAAWAVGGPQAASAAAASLEAALAEPGHSSTQQSYHSPAHEAPLSSLPPTQYSTQCSFWN